MKTIQVNWITLLFLIIVSCGAIGKISPSKAKVLTMNAFSRVVEKRSEKSKECRCSRRFPNSQK